jgi:hypothetical protein
MNEPTFKLRRDAEELLRDFPLMEPDFEAQAKAIEARLKGEAEGPSALLPARAGLSVDDLFKAPPLAAEAGEPPSRPRAAEAPKSNFAEMARKSLQKKGDDDDAQFARELLAATAQNRRPSAEMVERVRAAGRASATLSPLPTGESTLSEDIQRTSGVVARAPEPSQVAPNNRGTLIGIAGGVLALAACVALFLKSGQPEQSPTEAALAAEKASVATPAASPATLTAPPEAKQGEAVLSPEALAAAPANDPSPATAKGGVPRAAAGPIGVPSKAPTPNAAAKPEAVVLRDDPEPAPPASHEPKPEATAEPPLKPAEGNTGGVPLTPSAGAISSALNGVRGSAQQCLAGQTAPVSASVTFAADGHVLRVSASGPAAACIQAALSKARIQPFAKDSFTANTTIRPP